MSNQTKNSLIGQYVGKYRIDELLGRGGMAEVYRAYQENLDRDVAIKLMYPFLAEDDNFVRRFQREARALATLNHPHIIDVYDFDVVDHRYYIVMQYLRGGTLKELVEGLADRKELLPLDRAIEIILEVADALAYAHASGMVHRDIKPGNIMLDSHGKAILTDFGIARMAEGANHTATGSLVGTPAYMSPEQGLGQPGDARSDLYALGVVFYSLVTGQLPFEAETPIGVVMKHINEPVPSPAALNGTLPVSVEEIILRLLAKKPERRFASAAEFSAALTQVATDGVVSQRPGELARPLQGVVTLLEPFDLASGYEDGTQIMPAGGDHTEVMSAPEVLSTTGGKGAVLEEALPVQNRRRPAWLWPALLLLVVILGGGGWWLASGGFGGGEPPASGGPVAGVESTSGALAAAVAATETPAEAPTETPPPTATIVPSPTQTLEPTATATQLPTATPVQLPTADPTVVFLDSCLPGVELLNVHSYRNPEALAAPAGARLSLTWIFSPLGACPWPAPLRLVHVDGAAFGQQGGVPLELVDGVETGGRITVVAENLGAPAEPGRYPSSWQLVGEAGDPFGPRIDFELLVYQPATPTPAATPVPQATPTAASAIGGSADPLGFNVFFNRCEYPGGGTEYRCEMLITPFGGPESEYTVFVFDGEQPSRYFGGNQVHFVNGRRCAPWVHEIKVQNEASGESFSRNIYFDPTSQPLFPGGTACTES